MVLATPWQPDPERKPKKRLPTDWHDLMEACLEMTMRASILQVSSASLTPHANSGVEPIQVGKWVDYYFRSWFIHVAALAEATDRVIALTAKLYVSDRRERDKTKAHYREQVRKINDRVRNQRNQYVHGRPESWAKGMTEDCLWEGVVAVSMTPQKFLDEFHYPEEGKKLMSGKYNAFTDETTWILDQLGLILEELEEDIAGPQVY